MDTAGQQREHTLDAMRRFVQAAERVMRAVAGEYGIVLTELTCVRRLAAFGPQGPGDLAEHVGVSASSMTPMVDRLLRRGLVSRTPHPGDRRRAVVTLTTAGEQCARRVREQFGAAVDMLPEHLGGATADVMDALAQAVEKQLSEDGPDALGRAGASRAAGR